MNEKFSAKPISKILKAKHIKEDTYEMSIMGFDGKIIEDIFLRCVCLPSVKGGKQDSSGCFIMDCEKDFYAHIDGNFVIFMRCQKKTIL